MKLFSLWRGAERLPNEGVEAAGGCRAGGAGSWSSEQRDSPAGARLCCPDSGSPNPSSENRVLTTGSRIWQARARVLAR